MFRRKQKNEDVRGQRRVGRQGSGRVVWWLLPLMLLVGVVIGAGAMSVIANQAQRGQMSERQFPFYQNTLPAGAYNGDPLFATATAIKLQEETRFPQQPVMWTATPLPQQESLFATATAIIWDVTATAGAGG